LKSWGLRPVPPPLQWLHRWGQRIYEEICL
jgi:hypothetical protein